ncbi:MAG: GNAT family N-acetyltransferase [Candidatus Melainabacteria bacterium]
MFHQTELYQSLWWAHVAPQLDLAGRFGNWAILKKKVLKGLYTVKQMKLAGWENDWAQQVTADDMAQLSDPQTARGWDYLKITTTPSLDNPNFWEWVTHQRCPYAQWESSAEFLIDFSQGWETYWEARSSKVRCEYRRKIKKAADQQPEFRLLNHEAPVDTYLAQFYEGHTAYWRDKGTESVFATPHGKAFFTAWVKALTADDQLRFYGFFLNGRLTSMRFGVLHGGVYYSLVTVNTGDFQEFSPGVIALHEELVQLAGEGVQTYNMGPGALRYKTDLATQKVPYLTALVANPRSTTGKLVISRKKQDLEKQAAEEAAAATAKTPA